MRIWYSFFNDTATTEIYTLSRTRRSSDLVVRRLGIPDDYVERITELETAEVERRLRHFRGERPQPEVRGRTRSEEHTSELQSRQYLVCRLLLEKKTSRRPRLPRRSPPEDR